MKLLNTPFTIPLFVILALATVSCNTAKRATNYLNDHNEFAAQYCATNFKGEDSIISVHDTLIKADNKDYTGEIDSLLAQVDETENKRRVDSLRASLSHTVCVQVVDDLQKDNAVLKSRIVALQQAYKPCKPDTLFITKDIVRPRIAYEKSLENDKRHLQDSVLLLTHDNDRLQAGRNWWRLRFFILLGLVIGYGVLKFKRFI